VIGALHAGQERYFACAYMAAVSEELRRRSFDERPWPEVVSDARAAIARALSPQRSDRDARGRDRNVSLFPNTTGALTRVLAQVQRSFTDSRPTLLSTDLEYPGCVAAINDGWNAPVVMVRLASGLIGEARCSEQHLHDALTRAYNVVKPRVVLVSHIVRTTGQMLSPQTLRYFREANPRVVIIVDGSQAAGNVVVNADVLQLCDFYISSGHKWLGGMATSGFVWHERPARWQVDDYAQSVARGGQQGGGSGNAAAWQSLTVMIEEMVGERPRDNLNARATESRRLAGVFCRELSGLPGVRILTPLTDEVPGNGIVTITLPRTVEDTLVTTLAEKGYRHSIIEREQVRWRSTPAPRFLLDWDQGYPVLEHADEYTETWPQRAHRFCFHYWHQENDVVALANVVRAHALASGDALRCPGSV
jgi:selenocysteine lyase/cysteine desulfurase